MLERLTIENFRRFKKLEINHLKRVNLIAGKNNTGKTGILEALLILLDRTFYGWLESAFRNCSNVGDQNENYWKWLFHNRETSRPIVITADTEEFSDYSIALGISDSSQPQNYRRRSSPGYLRIFHRPVVAKTTGAQLGTPDLKYGCVPLWVRPSDPQQDAIDYDRVVLRAGGEERLESLLRQIEPRLKTIRSIKPHGAPLLYVDLGLKEKIPAVHLGQGFIRLLSMYAEIIASGKKVLLIDEIENGLHYSVLTEIWRGLLNAAQQEDVQIFATTHSYECIRAAHAAFAETLDYDFALHRLEETKGEITVTTYDKQTLETSLASNFEIR